MKKIELTIQETGNIIANIENNNQIKYISYKDVINNINYISKNNKNITIIENTIEFYNEEYKVIINNYKNNKLLILNEIIERLIEQKQKIRKNELRKRKIKRVKIFATTVIISGVIVFSFFPNKEKEVYSKDNFEENILIAETELNDKNTKNNDDIQINEIILSQNNEVIRFVDKRNIEVNFESRVDSDKFKRTKDNYQDLITNISDQYGIDPNIMLAIATQESGIHYIDYNSPAIGLMQIEKAVWNNQKITAYNYEKGEYETVTITNEKLKDLEFNIKVSCMYFQNCLKNSEYNLGIAIQMYNYGYGNIEKLFKMYYGNNINLSEIFSKCDNSWLEYRNNINVGDKKYLEHILSYIEDNKEIECRKDNGKICYELKQSIIKKL